MSEPSYERLARVVSKSPDVVAEATIQVLESASAPGRDSKLSRAVLVRVLRAVSMVLKKTDRLESAASAPSDFEALLRLLEIPEVQSALQDNNPLAAAEIRGLRAVDNIIRAEGGCVSGEDAARLLGLKSRQAIDKARREGRLLALARGQNRYVYPVWQFKNGSILPGLKDVYKCLSHLSPWMIASYMISKNSQLDEKTPLDKLRAGDAASVVKAAASFGEHGAD